MKKFNLLFLFLLFFAAWSCKKNDPEPATGFIKGVVADAQSAEELENVRILVFESNSNTPVQSVITSADGTYRIELLPGSYYLKLYKKGYEHVPPRNISPIPFTIVVEGELENPLIMHRSATQDGGYISGKVLEAGKGVPGVLVVGEKDGKGYSFISDKEGNFYLYNLPAGSYTIKGWVSGYESEQKTVSVATAGEASQNISLTKGAGGSVSGALSFLASTAVEVDVALTHPLTEEAVPGLNTRTTSNYTISNVPAGLYLARATYQNDERVVDPDWIVKFGEPYVEAGSGTVTRNFSLTGSVKILEPTNQANTTIPLEITTTSPVFSWTAYPSTDDYVIEVSDASGNVIWGGFDYSADIPVKKVVIPSSQTSVAFNADGKATQDLEPGKVYRWKIYASKNDRQAASGWRLISVSEDQLGLIKIAN